MDKLTAKHLEDFILEDSFKQFVCNENQESVEKWQKWINDNPLSINEFETAILVMKLLLKTRKGNYKLNTEEALEELLTKIRQEKEGESIHKPFFRMPGFRIAAMITLILSITGILYLLTEKYWNKPTEIVYNEIIVPLGEKSQVILADGTHIWINSSSRLKYPATFNKKERTIFLEGEAFFDVKKNDKQAFVVNTPDLKVKVLGTAFNIKNYPEDKSAVTTVVRGLVSVGNRKDQEPAVYLNPNENYIIYKTDKASDHMSDNVIEKDKETDRESFAKTTPIINKRVNVEAITSWKDQMLVFSDETLEDVALKMERWYNVKIYILNDELKNERYRGKFVNNENIYQVLEAIKFTTPLKYNAKNNKFYLDKP